MRRQALEAHVRELIENAFTGDDADVAATLLAEADADHGFGALCTRLDQRADGDRDTITAVFTALVEELEDHQLDAIAHGKFECASGWLSTLVQDVQI